MTSTVRRIFLLAILCSIVLYMGPGSAHGQLDEVASPTAGTSFAASLVGASLETLESGPASAQSTSLALLHILSRTLDERNGGAFEESFLMADGLGRLARLAERSGDPEIGSLHIHLRETFGLSQASSANHPTLAIADASPGAGSVDDGITRLGAGGGDLWIHVEPGQEVRVSTMECASRIIVLDGTDLTPIAAGRVGPATSFVLPPRDDGYAALARFRPATACTEGIGLIASQRVPPPVLVAAAAPWKAPRLSAGRHSLEMDPNQSVWLRLQTRAGRLYTVETDMLEGVDTAILLGLDGSEWLAADDDGGGSSPESSLASRVHWTAIDDGPMMLNIHNLAETGGRFDLVVTESEPLAALSTGQIDVQMDSTSAWVFDAVAGTYYVFGAASDDIDPYLRVIGADGEAAANDDAHGETLDALVRWLCPRDGRYSLVLSDVQSGAGSVRLSMHAEEVPRIEVGETLGRRLDDPAGAIFRFTAREGDVYAVRIHAAEFDSTLAIVRGGEQLAFNDDDGDSHDAALCWTAPEDGEFYIEVGTYGGGDGAYVLGLDQVTVGLGMDGSGGTAVCRRGDDEAPYSTA